MHKYLLNDVCKLTCKKCTHTNTAAHAFHFPSRKHFDMPIFIVSSTIHHYGSRKEGREKNEQKGKSQSKVKELIFK